MLKNKRFISLLLLLSAVFALPAWGAAFKNQKITEQQFLDFCRDGTVQEVRKALKEGANANAKNNIDETALKLAAMNNSADVVNALLSAGAEINVKDSKNKTELMYAADYNQDVEVIKALLKAGADVNAKDTYNRTALMFAAKSNTAEVINTLIEAGADDVADSNGKTALIYAAQYNEPEAVEALINAGTYIRQKDSSGKMAVDYARKNKKFNPGFFGFITGFFTTHEVLQRLEELSVIPEKN